MSIQRYQIYERPTKDDGGLVVLYANHITDKQAALDAQQTAHAAELHHLLSALADIREALGVGEKPMLSELAGIIRTRMGVIKILERDAAAHAAEVERLTEERDNNRLAGIRATKRAYKAMMWWRSKYRTLFKEAAETALVLTRNFVKMKHRAESAEAERDAAVAAKEETEERAIFWKGESCAVRLQKDSYAGSLKSLRFERDAAVAAKERAEEALREMYDELGELNTSNYDHGDVEDLNNASIAAIRVAQAYFAAAQDAKPANPVIERHAKCDECGWTGPESNLLDNGMFIYCPQCRNSDGKTLRPVDTKLSALSPEPWGGPEGEE